MSNTSKAIALIPARGGSKSIPHKNIKPLHGKPLLVWSIETARATPAITRIIVSTDDAHIAEVAKQNGAEVITRPAHLAEDHSQPLDVVKQAITSLRQQGENSAYMVYLEPTSPLRIPSDISRCLHLLQKQHYRSVATFSAAELNPHRAWVLSGNTPQPFIPEADPWLPRQQLPEAYQMNGAVYTFKMEDMLHQEHGFLPAPIGAVQIPKQRAVDIDDDIDFSVAEVLMQRRMNTHEDA